MNHLAEENVGFLHLYKFSCTKLKYILLSFVSLHMFKLLQLLHIVASHNILMCLHEYVETDCYSSFQSNDS